MSKAGASGRLRLDSTKTQEKKERRDARTPDRKRRRAWGARLPLRLGDLKKSQKGAGVKCVKSTSLAWPGRKKTPALQDEKTANRKIDELE